MIDIQVGALNAKPTPIRNTLTRITPGLKRCSEPTIAKPAAAAASQRFITHSNFLRSTMSAMAPAGSVNRKKDTEATVAINVSVLLTARLTASPDFDG